MVDRSVFRTVKEKIIKDKHAAMFRSDSLAALLG